ncbi:MAG TPA: NAD-dependent epimerase/dehydratase family protein [Polyangiaceae bacterium]|jgi:nucleoside-diphosphate-sugar epimerase|nr:NAD-dependent epimerase/dehydratase family protein [Polyangiaceae bacterium]
MADGRSPIVVTGSSGFVGANLIRFFAAKGARVIGVEGPTGLDWRTRNVPGLELVKLDLSSEVDVKAFIRESQPLAVLNCAAYGAYPSQTEANRIYRVNFDGTRYMLEALRGIKSFRAFVQAGSSSEYGHNCSGPSEDAPTSPDSDYAVSKVATTALIQCYATKYGIPGWVLRLYSVYGPFEDFSRLMPRLLLEAREKNLPPLVNPTISRDFVYVDDVSRAFEAVVENSDRLRRGQIYNVGVGARVTLEELVDVVRTTFGIEKSPQWGSMPDRHWDHADWFSNPRKAGAELGWSAKTSLVDGLRATMRWMESNPDLVRDGQKSSVAAAAS